jgi:hypothetical protein
MWHINALLDWQTGEKAEAGATFQVIELKDDEENDLTDLVDQGRHFHSIAGRSRLRKGANRQADARAGTRREHHRGRGL